MNAQTTRAQLVARLPERAGKVLARRQAPAAQSLVAGQPQRVLQTGRAPAQLSLFLQPRSATAPNRIQVSRTNP